MAKTIRTETRKRGIFGWFFLILFWAFNALMAMAILFGISGSTDRAATLASEAEKAGHAIGTFLGVGMLVSLWAAGALILGLLVAFTRGKKVIIETSEANQ